MNIVGEKVIHKRFGEGKVTEQEETTVSIVFSSSYGTKKFLYPSAFETFLTLCKKTTQKKFQERLEEIRAKEAEIQAQKEEDKRQRKEEVRLWLEEKKNSTPKKVPAKKATTLQKKKPKEQAGSAGL